MLTGLLWNKWSFLGLLCLIQALCIYEYFKLQRNIDKETHQPIWLQVLTQCVAAGLVFVMSLRSGAHWERIMWDMSIVVLVIPAVMLLGATLSKKNSFAAAQQAFGALLYITLPMIFLLQLYQRDSHLPLYLILMIWSNDTMAYLVGSFIGKTSLSPISPKKTWEGTVGGIMLTIIAAGVYGYYSNTYIFTDWIAIAFFATIAGTFGDLLESKLKRMADVKDSGAIMPGHGGALDRFDSLLVATPFVFLYVVYFLR